MNKNKEIKSKRHLRNVRMEKHLVSGTNGAITSLLAFLDYSPLLLSPCAVHERVPVRRRGRDFSRIHTDRFLDVQQCYNRAVYRRARPRQGPTRRAKERERKMKKETNCGNSNSNPVNLSLRCGPAKAGSSPRALRKEN